MPSSDSRLTQSYVITLADLNIPPQNKPTQPCAGFCEQWASEGSFELLACLRPCSEPKGTSSHVPGHCCPHRAKVCCAGSSRKVFWRGRNLTRGSDAQSNPLVYGFYIPCRAHSMLGETHKPPRAQVSHAAFLQPWRQAEEGTNNRFYIRDVYQLRF